MTKLRLRPLLPILAFACTEGSPAGGPVVRDSAGVRIVENPAGVPNLTWRLSSEPILEVGGVSVGPDYELFQVASAVRLTDGRIVIANGGSYELRFYAADGTHLMSVGRQGDGPGEFQNLRWMRGLTGDSLITYDFRHRRFSVFDGGGMFARSFGLVATEAVPFASIVDLFADGSFLMQGFANNEGVPPSGLQRYDAPLYHFGDDGRLLAELGMFSGNDSYYKSFAGGRGFAYYESFFPHYTYRVTAGDHIYIAANDTYELRRYTPEGKLTGIVRRAHTPIVVTREHARLERVSRLEQASVQERETLAEVLDEMPVPETFPAYQLARVDQELNIWVQEYLIPGADNATWSVFDSMGVMLAQLEAPLRFEPYHTGRDFVLGRWRNEDDVEYIRLYELVKPQGDERLEPLGR